MQKWKLARLAGIPAFVVATMGTGHAAVPEAVSTALSGLSADGVTIATAVLVAIIAIFAFKFMRRGL